MPPVHVSPDWHLFIGWHVHPSDPAGHMVVSTMPEAPAGITHIPDLQTPLAQSGPVAQVVFGSIPLGIQYPPSRLPPWQWLSRVQREPPEEPQNAPPPDQPSEVN